MYKYNNDKWTKYKVLDADDDEDYQDDDDEYDEKQQNVEIDEKEFLELRNKHQKDAIIYIDFTQNKYGYIELKNFEKASKNLSSFTSRPVVPPSPENGRTNAVPVKVAKKLKDKLSNVRSRALLSCKDTRYVNQSEDIKYKYSYGTNSGEIQIFNAFNNYTKSHLQDKNIGLVSDIEHISIEWLRKQEAYINVLSDTD